MSQTSNKDRLFDQTRFLTRNLRVLLELIMYIRLALNLERPACLCLPSAVNSPPGKFLPSPNHKLKWRLSNHVIQILSPNSRAMLKRQWLLIRHVDFQHWSHPLRCGYLTAQIFLSKVGEGRGLPSSRDHSSGLPRAPHLTGGNNWPRHVGCVCFFLVATM